MQPIKEITDSLLKYILPDDSTDEEKESNPIAAREVVDAIKAGTSVEIVNAVIEGPLNLESVVVEGKITIQRSKIKGPVDCSYAEFRQVVNFHSSQFDSDVNLTAATIEKDITLNAATFQGKVDLTDIQIKEALYAQSCTFWEDFGFMAAQVGRRCVFMGGVFKQKAMFTGCKIGGSAFFDSGEPATGSVKPATFGGEANFVSAQIDDRAMFSGVIFKQKADFAGIRIGSNAEFDGVLFGKGVCFHGAHIGDSGFFKNSVFIGDADFAYIWVGTNVHFTEATFTGKANFNSAKIQGHAVYNQATFEGNVDYSAAAFGGGGAFAEIRFNGPVSFFASRFDMDAGFGKTVFAKNISFLNVMFRTVFFGMPGGQVTTKFEGSIDLLGCTYDRIEPISIWEQLLDRLERYDRQPYAQLEQTFRRAGHDGLANKVYYGRKRMESKRIRFWRRDARPGAWILDRLHWLLTGYGVRVPRILVPIVLILIIGTFVFQVEGAVVPRQCLTCPEAFWVSLNQFLPVAIPAGSELQPSSQSLWGIMKFTTFATLLKLLGWILVPVGVAGLSGWLKR